MAPAMRPAMPRRVPLSPSFGVQAEDLDLSPGPDDSLVLSNVRRDGRPTGLADGGTCLHTDGAYLAQPARATPGDAPA